MFNREVFGMAVDRFKKHPVQTSLTLAGLVVGTAAIILVVSLGLTGREYVLRQIEGVGSKLVWVNYRGTVTAGVSRAADDVLTDSDIHAIAARTDLFSGVTGILTLRGTITVQSQAKTLTILGVLANYGEVRKNMRILRGRSKRANAEDDTASSFEGWRVSTPNFQRPTPNRQSSILNRQFSISPTSLRTILPSTRCSRRPTPSGSSRWSRARRWRRCRD